LAGALNSKSSSERSAGSIPVTLDSALTCAH
jgi:hypothetical protein